MVGGSPCQNISNLNLKDRRGLNGEKSSLFFDYVRILNHSLPKVFLFENVRRLKTVNDGKDFEIVLDEFSKHYNCKHFILNSKYFGVSQNRERLFVVGIRKDIKQDFLIENLQQQEPIPLSKHIELGCPLDYRYYIREKSLKIISQENDKFKGKMRIKDIHKDVGFCLTVGGSKSRTDNFLYDIHGVRTLTERERFSMQGFNPDYVNVLRGNGVTKTILHKVSGNTITVPVLEEIFKELLL